MALLIYPLRHEREALYLCLNLKYLKGDSSAFVVLTFKSSKWSSLIFVLTFKSGKGSFAYIFVLTFKI